MRTRLQGQEGFGLIELLASLVMLNVGILAIVAAFNSGLVALHRASRLSTAAALADTQMERYRALKYDSIRLDTTSVAATDAVYQGDSAYSASQITATCSGVPDECNPSRTASGADGATYRVDTYIVQETPPSGRPLKRVTIVIRDAGNLSRTLAREASTFDQSTGS